MFPHAKFIVIFIVLVVLGHTSPSGAEDISADIVEYFPNGDFEVGNFDLEIMRSPRYGVPPVNTPTLESLYSIAGKSSLRLPSIGKGHYRLVTRAVDLPPDQQYHFSLAAGMEQQGTVLVEVFGSDGSSGKKVAEVRKSIAQGIENISLSFSTATEFTRYWFRLFLSGDGDFKLDELSLKGPNSNNQQPKKFGLWLFPDKPLGVYKLGESGAMHVHIQPGTGSEITYEIADAVTGEKLMSSKTVPLGIGGKVKLPLVTGKRGYFMVSAVLTLSDGGQSSTANKPYVVIPTVAADIPIDRRFGLCMEEHGQKAYIDAHYSADDLYALARDIGAGSVRLFSLAKPEMLSSDGVSFNYTELDEALSLAVKYDLQVMIPLGSNSPHNVPDWLRTAVPEGNVDLVGGLKTDKLRSLVIQDKENYLNIKTYEVFLDALLAHLRGKVYFFEIWNEPGHKFFVEDTLKLMAATNRAKTRVHPQATILGPSSSKGGGTGQGIDPAVDPAFVSAVIAAGGGVYIDKLSFHSEHAFRFMGDEFDLRNQETGYVPRLRRILSRYGKKDLNIWDTERGMPWRSRYSDSGKVSYAVSDIDVTASLDLIEAARQLPMVFAADISNDVKRTFWFYFDAGYTSMQSTDYSRSMFDLYNEPTPMIPVYAAMTEKLAGAVYHSKVEWQDGTRVYLFSRDGSIILLAYNWQEKNSLIALDTSGGSGEIFDAMGNQQSDLAQGKSISLNGWPQYIVIKDKNPDDIHLNSLGDIAPPTDFNAQHLNF